MLNDTLKYLLNTQADVIWMHSMSALETVYTAIQDHSNFSKI